MSIVRNSSGFNKFYPKYTLMAVLPDENGQKVKKELLVCKKRPINRTANYLISMDPKNLKAKGPSYLGKLRATNTKKTEYLLFDSGENPVKAKPKQEVRKAYLLVEFMAQSK